jgi:hypothetical protein
MGGGLEAGYEAWGWTCGDRMISGKVALRAILRRSDRLEVVPKAQHDPPRGTPLDHASSELRMMGSQGSVVEVPDSGYNVLSI